MAIIIHIEAQTLPELLQRLKAEVLMHAPAFGVALPGTPQEAPQQPAQAPVETPPAQDAKAAEKAAKEAEKAAAKAAKEAEKAAKEAEKAASASAGPAITIEALRAKMGEVVAMHPDKGAAVSGFLAAHANGAKNLSSADPSTYAALMDAATAWLAANAGTVDPTA